MSLGVFRAPNDITLFFASTQLFQLDEQLAPLDLGDAKFLPYLIWLFTCAIVVQRAGPAAHVKREMLRQPGLIAGVFEQILQPPRRPREELFCRPVLSEVYVICAVSV